MTPAKMFEGDLWVLASDAAKMAEKAYQNGQKAEREKITNLLLYLHSKAAPYHNYYKHAAVELNRKAGEGEKI
jgi:hypothetical protein